MLVFRRRRWNGVHLLMLGNFLFAALAFSLDWRQAVYMAEHGIRHPALWYGRRECGVQARCSETSQGGKRRRRKERGKRRESRKEEAGQRGRGDQSQKEGNRKREEHTETRRGRNKGRQDEEEQEKEKKVERREEGLDDPAAEIQARTRVLRSREKYESDKTYGRLNSCYLGGTLQTMRKVASRVFKKMQDISALMTFILVSLGWKTLRSQLSRIEVQFVAGLCVISLYLGFFEIILGGFQEVVEFL
uniref:Putative transmembrane protein n=1 Tax=Toxoplasma gondii TgCATBr9 TaxID=943120 RepID=A0A2T6IEZ7_TOXGO|nr:putative transmembrane protein [Toxoplasma gondii TgCATBr9]